MKKIISLFLAGILSLSLAACGSSNSSNGDLGIDSGLNNGNVDLEQQVKDYVGSEANSKLASTGEYIIKDGKTDYKIVYPEKAGSYIFTAIEELNLFIGEATGVQFEAIADTQAVYSNSAKYISIGKTTLMEEANVVVKANLGSSGTQLVTKGKSVFIFGANDNSSLYAAYDFLGYILDFDYIYKNCYNLDRNVTDIELKSYNETNIPDIEFRSSGYGWTDADALMANRMRLKHKEAQMVSVNGLLSHNSFRYVADHDDGHEGFWYAPDGNQLCYTARGNAEEYEALQEACLSTMKDSLKADLTGSVITFTQEDIGTWCTCSACTAVADEYGAKSAILVLFMNDLRGRLDAWFETEEGQEYYRDLELIFFSYHQTVTAPATYDAETDTFIPNKGIHCNEGVSVWYAPIQADYTHSLYHEKNKGVYDTIRSWMAISNKIFLWTYSTGFANYFAWYNSFDGMQDTYRLAKEAGALYIMDQAQWTTTECYSWGSLKSYLNARLAWDVDADVEMLTDRYFKNYYGPVANEMKAYYLKQRVYLTWLSDNTAYSCARSCSNGDIGLAKFWPKPVLMSWLEEINGIIDQLDDLRRQDPELYEMYYYRIAMERLSCYFMLVDLYSYNTSASLINEWKLQFKKDAKALGLEGTNESSRTIDQICEEWGI